MLVKVPSFTKSLNDLSFGHSQPEVESLRVNVR